MNIEYTCVYVSYPCTKECSTLMIQTTKCTSLFILRLTLPLYIYSSMLGDVPEKFAI